MSYLFELPIPVRQRISGAIRHLAIGDGPRDFILTGIPRSGTSLLSSLLTRARNCVCFNEIYYDARSLPLFFEWMRIRLRFGRTVPNRADRSGKLITSTSDQNKRQIRWLQEPVDDNPVLGSKVTTGYLDKIEVLLDHGYPIVAMVRDPLFALGSWNTEKLANTPLQAVQDDDMADHWRHIDFESDDTIQRQAEIWEHYAQRIRSWDQDLLVIRYEDLTEDQGSIRSDLAGHLGLDFDEPWPKLRNMNEPGRYPEQDRIEEAVKALCPTRVSFGYG